MLIFVVSEEGSKVSRNMRVLVNKEVSHFIDILFARRLLRPTARILSSSLTYKESRLV